MQDNQKLNRIVIAAVLAWLVFVVIFFSSV